MDTINLIGDFLDKIISESLSKDLKFIVKSVAFSYAIGLGIIAVLWLLVVLIYIVYSALVPFISYLGTRIYQASAPLYFVFRRILIPILFLPFTLIPNQLIFNLYMLLYTPIWFFLLEFQIVDVSLYRYKLYYPTKLSSEDKEKKYREHKYSAFPRLDTCLTPTWFISNYFYNWTMIIILIRQMRKKSNRSRVVSRAPTLMIPQNNDDMNISRHSDSGSETPTLDRVYRHRKLSEHGGSIADGLQPDLSMSPNERVPFREFGHDDEHSLPPLAATLIPVMKREPSLRMIPFMKRQTSLGKPVIEMKVEAKDDVKESVVEPVDISDVLAPTIDASNNNQQQLIQETKNDDSEVETTEQDHQSPSSKPLLSIDSPGLSINEVSPEPSPYISPDSHGQRISLDDKIRLFGGRSPSMKPRSSTRADRSESTASSSTADYDINMIDTRYMSRSVDLSSMSMPYAYMDGVNAVSPMDQHPGPHNARAFWKSRSTRSPSLSLTPHRGSMNSNMPLSPIMLLETESEHFASSSSPLYTSSMMYHSPDRIKIQRASTFSGFGMNHHHTSANLTHNRLITYFMSMKPESSIGHDIERDFALYSYKEIIRRNYCKDFSEMNSRHLEWYLTDQEFLTLFTMNKSEYKELPKWRQVAIKKALTLF